MIATAVIIIVGLLLVIWVISIYNGLVSLRNQVKNAFSQIDVQLKRRYDLIPNLVETAKGYMKHEAGTLEAVIAARNQASAAQKAMAGNPADPDLMKKLLSAEGNLGASLGRFAVTLEAYPDLKASSTMGQLMEELASTENKISFARQAFNDSVLGYNNKREMFPGSIIAGTFNFQPAAPYEIENASQRENVKVSFS